MLRSDHETVYQPVCGVGAFLYGYGTRSRRDSKPHRGGTRYIRTKPETLLATVQKYLDEAVTPMPSARFVGCIVPHDAFGLSGAVAAHAFKGLKPGQYDRVLILAPSHFTDLEGCFRAGCGGFCHAVWAWCRWTVFWWIGCAGRPLITCKAIRNKAADDIHGKEYGVETLLPFLQVTLQKFTLVPILVGSFKDAFGQL